MFQDPIRKQIPLGPLAAPEDIPEAVLYVANDRSAVITGVVFGVNGGWLLGIAADYQGDPARRTDYSAANFKQCLER